MEQVVEVVRTLNLPARRLEQFKTAGAEATMNALEHGNHYRRELPVSIRVLASSAALAVRIIDQGGSRPIANPDTPVLETKLTGRQTPRGWGRFLIKSLVDEVHEISDEAQHTVELIPYLDGTEHVGTMDRRLV